MPAAVPPRRRSRLRIAAALAVSTVLLAACGGSGEGTGRIVPDGRLTIAMAFGPGAGYAIDTDDAFVLSQLGVTEPLVASGADGRPRPALATEWARTDPRTWRFALRPGVTFQNGEPLTGHAVATALNRLAGVEAPPRAVRGIGLTAAPDGATAVRVTTTAPDPILPLRLSSANTAILAPSAYASDPPAVQGTGTGPMTITRLDGTQSVELQRNETYWGERPQLAGVTANFVPDPAARALALRAGDADIAQELPEATALEFTGDGYVNESVAAPRTASLLLNQSRAPFSDIRVRQAVAAAVDRAALGEQALAGSAVPASELFGPAVSWGSQEPPPPADPARARRLLAEAGFGPSRPLRVELGTYANRPELPTLATAVQEMLRAAGIEATIRVGDYDAREADLLAGRYDMYLASRSYLLDVPDAGATLRTDYTCRGSYNINRYCSPEFDALLAPLTARTDPAARQEVFTRAAAKLNADVVGVPLVHTRAGGVGSQVAGYTVDPLAKTLVVPGLAKTG
ncbi:ABC transporter substrate-binding protein [Pseudonocardia sp. C8]|uniref:ABC transporter substrate-binding protein n=1 Tax=Pseudonocardia sp. C8 TaxID=2762759 RepID=UPI0016431F62|nr:ABC transporter substrate-binding protein [Pseudonocardia sp. C8]MBC3194646.1 ABC transporter substrate-binding protein [Pseudonocardia sp. C8]